MFPKLDYHEPSCQFLEEVIPQIPGVIHKFQTGKCNLHADHYKENGEKLVHACIPCFMMRHVLVEHKVGESTAGAMACPWPPAAPTSQRNEVILRQSVVPQKPYLPQQKKASFDSSESVQKPKDCVCPDEEINEDFWVWTFGQRFCRACSDEIPCICHLWDEFMYVDFADFCQAWTHDYHYLSENDHDRENAYQSDFLNPYEDSCENGYGYNDDLNSSEDFSDRESMNSDIDF